MLLQNSIIWMKFSLFYVMLRLLKWIIFLKICDVIYSNRVQILKKKFWFLKHCFQYKYCGFVPGSFPYICARHAFKGITRSVSSFGSRIRLVYPNYSIFQKKKFKKIFILLQNCNDLNEILFILCNFDS